MSEFKSVRENAEKSERYFIEVVEESGTEKVSR